MPRVPTSLPPPERLTKLLRSLSPLPALLSRSSSPCCARSPWPPWPNSAPTRHRCSTLLSSKLTAPPPSPRRAAPPAPLPWLQPSPECRGRRASVVAAACYRGRTTTDRVAPSWEALWVREDLRVLPHPSATADDDLNHRIRELYCLLYCDSRQGPHPRIRLNLGG
jgi:hypothetical protein